MCTLASASPQVSEENPLAHFFKSIDAQKGIPLDELHGV